tara:strand:+ start:1022 stop:1450 length:429 start_codon:yes stop_codon:yes gene_type:complete
MPTTTASIALSSDIGDSSISLNNTMTLFKAGSGSEGMDTMTSVSKILQSTDQVDLVAAATAGSTDHNFLYIKNPSTNPAEFFRIALGASPAGSGTVSIVEELGYLYAGDWMFIPWGAGSTAFDVMITPSVSTDMSVEYMIFS